jgi:hypothetical protein
MISEEKTKNELLKEYFCAIVPEDIMTIDKLGKIKIDGIEISEGEKIALIEEAKFFRESRLYKIMMNTPKKMAMEAMYNLSQSYDDMKSGKMMLYNLSVQEKLINGILRSAK